MPIAEPDRLCQGRHICLARARSNYSRALVGVSGAAARSAYFHPLSLKFKFESSQFKMAKYQANDELNPYDPGASFFLSIE